MGFYRKKPVVIEAIQYTGENRSEVLDFDSRIVARFPDGDHHVAVYTLEGKMRADEGDYIIRGVRGEVYPCKPDIFEATYEPAE